MIYVPETIELEHPSDKVVFMQRHTGNVEIIDINVSSGRRMGRGRELIRLLKERAKELPVECKLIFAITRNSNRIAQDFYNGLNFRVLATLYHFYKDTNENAIMYGLDLY